ncbi:MAG: selenide, water dikinase SelD [Calditrichaeota bacterium]|nr:MAG: selenide, water dikinase SelD [Calditrichota bacterium]
MKIEPVKLTQYSHGSGCGCKIAPETLSAILHTTEIQARDPRLLVGNATRDDAAVYQLDDDRVIISTTDFFMPIVDDPFDFGAIASVNAISDIYAMGGTPLMAIAILGWPLDKLAPAVAATVLQGARSVCRQAGISLAGGHSIDAPEPIFGLAVTGSALKYELKTNDAAQPGDFLYLTKPLGVGIMTTAQKRGLLKDEDLKTVKKWMLTLNAAGRSLALMEGVHALTDVTGFGLLGHLLEMCEGSSVSAELDYHHIPLMAGLEHYIQLKTFAGGIDRNHKSYGSKIGALTDEQKAVLCDPQTSGGLLVAVAEKDKNVVEHFLKDNGWPWQAIGRLRQPTHPVITIR